MKHSFALLSFECEKSIELEDVEDEFKREAALYAHSHYRVILTACSMRQALEAATKARRQIIASGLPFDRPSGYYAEPLKTEEHMKRISGRQEEKKEAEKAAEQARKQRANRKYGKQIQKAREQEKQERITDDKKTLTMLRKRKRDKEGDDDEFDIAVEDALGEEGPKKGAERRLAKKGKHVSKGRQVKNEKFGFGGQKRGMKRNDKESASKDEFSVKRNRAPFKGMALGTRGSGSKGGRGGKGGKGGRGGKMQRPGKERRQQVRNKKASKK